MRLKEGHRARRIVPGIDGGDGLPGDGFHNVQLAGVGREDDHPRDEPVGRIDSEPHNGMVVTFYQRLGDVGIWAFYDGSFQVCLYLISIIEHRRMATNTRQFNFPDHTKLILSADGSWCDFYHLPLEAARDRFYPPLRTRRPPTPLPLRPRISQLPPSTIIFPLSRCCSWRY